MALLEASFDNNNWVALPTPEADNYNPTYTHQEKSFLDSLGYLHRDIIRRNRAKVLVGWTSLNKDETNLLQTLYDYDYFYLKFTDNHSQRVIKKVYAGPLDGKVKYINPKNYEILKRSSSAMNFIEY